MCSIAHRDRLKNSNIRVCRSRLTSTESLSVSYYYIAEKLKDKIYFSEIMLYIISYAIRSILKYSRIVRTKLSSFFRARILKLRKTRELFSQITVITQYIHFNCCTHEKRWEIFFEVDTVSSLNAFSRFRGKTSYRIESLFFEKFYRRYRTVKMTSQPLIWEKKWKIWSKAWSRDAIYGSWKYKFFFPAR